MAATIKELKNIACEAIDQSAEELDQVSSELWNNPEQFYEEFHAHEVLTGFLEQNSFDVNKKYVLDTAFKGCYGDDGGPNIAVLCEYDALPEIGHACGHNLIAEVGIGAGIGVKAALVEAQRKNMKLGKVTVLGTPAEEDGGGKIDLINAGAFTDIDAAMMCHPFNFNTYKKNFLAIQELVVNYEGRGSHASAFPWEGLNALDAAVMAYTNISMLRQRMKPDWRVHGIITKGGTKPNIIPDKTSLSYYLRAPNREGLKSLKDQCVRCFEAAAVATSCKVKFKWIEKPYDNMVVNETVLSTFQKNAEQFDISYPEKTSGASGSTDMGNVSYAVSSIHPMFYIGDEKVIHTREFAKLAGSKKAQPYALMQAKIVAMTILDLLADNAILTKAKEEFKQRVQEK